MESSVPKKHKDLVAGRGFYFDDPLKFDSQIYSYATCDENVGCKKGAVDKEWKKLDTIPAWQLEKVTSKKEAVLCNRTPSHRVFLAHLHTYHPCSHSPR